MCCASDHMVGCGKSYHEIIAIPGRELLRAGSEGLVDVVTTHADIATSDASTGACLMDARRNLRGLHLTPMLLCIMKLVQISPPSPGCVLRNRHIYTPPKLGITSV